MHLPTTRRVSVPLVLGAAPLTIGISVFLLWLITGGRWLELVGIFVLYTGFASVVSGLVLLTFWVLRRIHSDDWAREQLMGRTIFVAIVLVINFPVAGLILWTTYNLSTRYTVVVRNNGSASMESGAITGGGVSLDLGSIDPGASVTKRFRIGQDGILMFSGEQGGRKLQIVVDGYVTNGGGGQKQIEIWIDAPARSSVSR